MRAAVSEEVSASGMATRRNVRHSHMLHSVCPSCRCMENGFKTFSTNILWMFLGSLVNPPLVLHFILYRGSGLESLEGHVSGPSNANPISEQRVCSLAMMLTLCATFEL